jgi:hypothetical protein
MAALDRYKERTTEILNDSERLAGLDLDDEAQAAEALSRVEDHDQYPEWWAVLVGGGAKALRERIEPGADSNEVAVIAEHLAFAWAMLVFTQHLEPLVWRGYESSGVEAMQRVLTLWEANNRNQDEAFWHGMFNDYPFILSQSSAASNRGCARSGLRRGQDNRQHGRASH